MRAGEFPDGAMTLRAKIDLASGNFNMRDPVHLPHQPHAPSPHRATSGASTPCTTSPIPLRTRWRASPTPCAPWSLRPTGPSTTGWSSNIDHALAKPRQIEFARLGIDHTVMSKRKLRQLVEEDYVSGWDDPRMPTLCGLRRRGYTPAVHPQLLRAHRRGQGGLHRGVRLPGALPAGGPERAPPSGSWRCSDPSS